LAYNFNNGLVTDTGRRDAGTAEPAQTSPGPDPGPRPPDAGSRIPDPGSPIPLTPVTSDNPESAAGVRFRSCRWMQKEDSGNQAFCTHREVKPYAGMQGFDADAWCPECQYYKLRRAPRKRSDDSYTY